MTSRTPPLLEFLEALRMGGADGGWWQVSAPPCCLYKTTVCYIFFP